MNNLILWPYNCISTKKWYATHHSQPCLKSTDGDFSVGFKWLLNVDEALSESYTCNDQSLRSLQGVKLHKRCDLHLLIPFPL